METYPNSNEGRSEPQDYECFVCYELMVEPSNLPCNHYMCLKCLRHVLLLKRCCPFCRTEVPNTFIPTVDQNKAEEIKNKHGDLYNKKLEELKAARNAQDTLTLVYGNNHTYVPNSDTHNHHSWDAFVRLSDDSLNISEYIQKVVFTLHPTFPRPVREVRKAPFTISSMGWGVFLIPIQIHWKPWLEKEPTEIEHFLSFDGNGDAHTEEVKFTKSIFKR